MGGLFTMLEKLKLNTALVLGFSLGLVVAAIVWAYGQHQLVLAQESMEVIYEKELLGISHIKEANINLMYMARSVRQSLIAQDEQTRNAARSQVSEARERLRKELDEGRKRIFREETIAAYEEFERHFARYNENITHALALIERETAASSEAAKFLTSKEFMATVNAADDALNKMTDIKERGAKEKMDAARERAESARLASILMLLAGLSAAVLLGGLVGRAISAPNNRLRSAVEDLAKGEVHTGIPHTEYPNEVGAMARSIAVLQQIYVKAENTSWIKARTAEISSALQAAEDVKVLAQTAVSKITPTVGASHAAYYVADDQEQFHLFGSYGYRERKHLSNTFSIGEGLVGQAAMEKAPITLSAPQDYIRIHSGLGEGPPAAVAVLPIIHKDRVMAVLELASFQAFTERETSLLDALLPTLATTMEIMDRNQKTRELLAETQELAGRMEKQAAQLEEQQVEMEAQQAELLETENWFRNIIETAPDGMLVADTSGQILLSNPAVEKIFGYAPGELVGIHVERLVPEDLRAKHVGLRQAFLHEGQSRQMGNGAAIVGRRKDGSEINVLVSLATLPARGTRGKCVSVSVRASES